VVLNNVVNEDTRGVTDINASFYILFRLLLPDERVVGVSVLRYNGYRTIIFTTVVVHLCLISYLATY